MIYFNDYVHKVLHYGLHQIYKPEIDIPKWDYKHKGNPQTTNVMPDLADAMKQNPNLKVLLNAGYFDLATPVLRGHLRDAPSSNSEKALFKHLLSFISIGTHGLSP